MEQQHVNKPEEPGGPVGFQDANERLSFALRAAGIGVWEIWLPGLRVELDAKCRALFGLADARGISHVQLLEAIHPRDAQQLLTAVRNAIAGQGEGLFDIQYRITGIDDKVLRWLRFSGQVFMDGTGQAQRIAGIAQDVTQTVQASQAILEAQGLSDMALESAGAGSFLIHLETDHIEYSPSLARIYTGNEGAVVTRRMLIEHLHPDDLAARKEAYRRAEQTGKLFYEARTVWNDGSIHWIEARGTYIPGPAGKPLVFAGVVQDITERKAAAAAIEQTERRLIDSFYQAPVGIAVLAREGLTFRVANAFYGELVGRAPGELIGKPLLEALPELDGQGFDQILYEVLETGVSYVQNEAPVQLIRNGTLETIYVDFVYQTKSSSDGSQEEVMAVVIDVTKQVQARLQISQSEAKFRSLIDEAPFATALYLGDDLIVDTANEAMIRLWGKTSDVVGMPLRRALPELEGQNFLDLLRQIRQTGETFHARAAPADLVVDGRLQRFWFNYTYKPLLDAQGKVYAILNMALDVTEEVLSRRQQEESQEALLNAIELAELGTWSLDIATGSIVVSNRMLDWFGLSAEEAMLGQAVSAIADEDRERVSAAIAAACRPGANGYSEEYRVINRQTGKRHIIHARGQLVYNAQGEPARLDGTARDITLERELQLALERLVQDRTEELAATNEELQATNEELQATNEELYDANNRLVHSNEELAQYAYVASHDLQEPLRKIRVFSGMLDQSGRLEAGERSLLGKIMHSAERMAMLIKDLLEFSKLLNSESVWQPVNLTQLVKAVRSDFELIVSEKGASIEIGELPDIEAVGLQMNQLFYNLIGNALKFVKPGVPPRIVIEAAPITAEEAGAYLGKLLPFATYYRISVSDNGIGFDVQYTEQIFEVFKRLHGREVYPGSGIGLALCRRIVANHMGTLYAESRINHGSVFHVILPDRQEEFVSSLPEGFSWQG